MTIAGLIARGALCHITEATVEWHPTFIEQQQDKKNADLVASIVASFRALDESFIGCRPVKIIDGDDESFTSDGQAFPISCGTV